MTHDSTGWCLQQHAQTQTTDILRSVNKNMQTIKKMIKKKNNKTGSSAVDINDSLELACDDSCSSCTHLHVVFLVDTTGSMQTYLFALKRALCQVCSLLHALFPANADVSVVAYEDYGDGSRLLRKVLRKPYQELYGFCEGLKPGGGGDLAEASKTALNFLSEMVHSCNHQHTFVVFHYTDAPPHHKLTNPSGSNRPKEIAALRRHPLGYDWCKISRRFRQVSDRVKIFTIVPEDSPAGHCGAAFYALLGELVTLPTVSPSSITKATMALILHLMGQESDPSFQRVSFRQFEDVMGRLKKNNDKDCNEDSFPELNSNACMEPSIRPTPKNHRDMEWTNGWVFSPLPQFSIDVSSIRSQFKESEAFRDAVFESMEKLVQPDNVMALTTNEIFGRMWRLVCTRRDDDRLICLQARMGDCVSSDSKSLITEEERSVLKDWLEASYNNAEEMNGIIKSHQQQHKNCKSFYVMDAFASDSLPDVDGLRSLGRSPCPKALASVQKILSHIMLVNVVGGESDLPVDDDGNCRYLPESLDDYQLFTMLPHLMQAGTQYSLKPAALLAILCCKSSESLLEHRARRFLRAIRGKWLPPVDRIDRPEILSYEFSNLVANYCPDADTDDDEATLTEEERQFFQRLHEIWRYRRGRFETFEVVTPFSPTRPMLLPDAKAKCRTCRQWTSKTLMDKNHVCGICLWMRESEDNVWERPKRGENYFVEKSESYMVECTACHVIYAVLGPEDLNVPPKCHFCRGLDKKKGKGRDVAPYRRCGCCKAKWCDPSLVLNTNDETGTFACPVCLHGGASSGSASSGSAPPASTCSHHQVTLNAIVDENPDWVKRLGFRPKGGHIIFSKTKLYEAIAHDRTPLFSKPKTDAVVSPLHHKGKRVLNEEGLLKNIQEKIATSTFVHTCQLCFDEKAVERLRPACGHCMNRCCTDCLKSWYGQNSPGELFIPSHDMCPFCRQRPQYQVLAQYNHQACAIVGQSRRKGAPLRLRADWYYGWCQGCWRVAYAMARSCAADGAVPHLKDFMCEDCVEKRRFLAEDADEEARTKLLLDGSKPCPGCQMLTTHLGGCSHMTCPGCKIHWCWQCGEFKASSGRDVYDHMRSKHGGYGWAHDNDDDYDGEVDDDDI